MTTSTELGFNSANLSAISAATILENIKYYELNNSCWCAIAQLKSSDSLENDLALLLSQLSKSYQSLTSSNSSTVALETPDLSSHNHILTLQRLGVRQLCYALLSHLNIQDDLDDSKHPY